MNELATNTGPPLSHIPTTPFPANTSFLESLTETHLYHLQNPHNLSPDEQNARRRFIARHSLKDLIPKYATQDDGGPFPLFSDDLQPTNILINPPIRQITGIIDWEFINAKPVQVHTRPAVVTASSGADMWIERFSMDRLLERYVQRIEQVIRALERAEAKEVENGNEASVVDGPSDSEQEEKLSAKMRESWKTGQFWFAYAARTSLDVDDIYWNALHNHEKEGDGEGVVGAIERDRLEELVRVKMEQLGSMRRSVLRRLVLRKSRRTRKAPDNLGPVGSSLVDHRSQKGR